MVWFILEHKSNATDGSWEIKSKYQDAITLVASLMKYASTSDQDAMYRVSRDTPCSSAVAVPAQEVNNLLLDIFEALNI